MSKSRDSVLLGTIFSAASALTYTVFNVCLRYASIGGDPAWINCVQASVSVAVLGAYMMWRIANGRRGLPRVRESVTLLVAGLGMQLGGVMFVWSMSVVGVAVAVTVQMGCVLVSGAIIGLILLGEPVGRPQIAAIALIILSVVFFSIGAPSTGGATANDSLLTIGILGIVGAALSGVICSAMSGCIRKLVTGDTLPQDVVFFVSVMGVVALGPWSVYHLGLDTLVQTPAWDFAAMLAAGVFNLIAYFLCAKSLQTLPLVRGEVIRGGVSTILTVVAGIMLFAELCNEKIILGIVFGTIGIMLINVPDSIRLRDQKESCTLTQENSQD